MTLDTSLPNHNYCICSVSGTPTQRRQYYHLGFLVGETVRCVFSAPCGNPIAFEVQGSVFALQKQELKSIEVCEVK